MSYLTEVLADTPQYYFRLADPAPPRFVGIGSVARDLLQYGNNGGQVLCGFTGPNSDGGAVFISGESLLMGFANMPAAMTMECWWWGNFWNGTAQGLVVWPVSGGVSMNYDQTTGGFRCGSGTHSVTSPVVSTQVWHHVVVTHTGALMTLYVDGVSAGSVADVLVANASSVLSVGASPVNTLTSGYFVSEAAVYASALSGARVAAHFAAADAVATRPTANDRLTQILNSVRVLKTTPGQV